MSETIAANRVAACLFALCATGIATSCIERAATTPEEKSTAAQTGIQAVTDVDVRLSAGLIGSAHDFTQSPERAHDLCTPCHTPHLTGARPALLDRRPETQNRLRSYEALGIDLDSASLLCLSCHDGVLARDVFTTAHATAFVRQLGASRLGVGGLTGHPIGVRYPVTTPTYRAPQIVTADGRVKLPDGRVQCISCHDPHNTERHESMLVRSNRGSRLCLTCHRI